MKKVFKVLKFFRIVDEQDLLSITNLAIYAVVIKISTADVTSLNDAALAIGVLLNYAHKKHVSKSK